MTVKVSTGEGGDDLRGQLDRLFAKQLNDATDTQRRSVQRWQSRDDRFYQHVQSAIEGGGIEDDEAADVAGDLDELMTPLPESVVVWRGLRDAAAVFGVSRDDLESIINLTFEQQRFTATSATRQVAMDEFTQPGRSPVLCRISAHAGCPVVWLPLLGAEEYSYQQELLFAPGVILRILGVDRAYSFPIVELEVTTGDG